VTTDVALGTFEVLIAIAVMAAAVLCALMMGRSGLTDREPVKNTASPDRMRHPASARPARLSAQAHWERVTAAVEQSLARAQDMRDHQHAAAQQLQAAEYALHTLLGELGVVMEPGIASPLKGRTIAIRASLETSTALAA
jgi:hypothetical protein